jgi:anti-sigma factor RsiW
MREALLEADLDALAGADDTPVGRHVRDCPACAAEAARILRATAALDSVLSTPPRLDARALVARALTDDTVQPDPQTAFPAGSVRRRPAHTTRWAALAAAACMAALFVWAERDRPLPGPPWTPSDAPAPTVETASGNVAVIETDDPDITVIWIF